MDEHEQLAWAAGFIDGDGSIAHNSGGYVSLHAGGIDPEPLLRLRGTLQCGNVTGPYDRRHPNRWSKRPQYFFQVYVGGDQAVARLWFALGTAKRTQALVAFCARDFGRSVGDFLPWPDQTGSIEDAEQSFRIGLAWAAGFFDAEGCFSSTARVGVSASITQTDRELLDRFRGVVGFGNVYGPYETKASDGFRRKPHYFYKAHGRERVQALLAMLWIWLGTAKRQQALDRLDWPTTCRRGHPKKPGHSGCADCTRAYWDTFRSLRREPGVGESAVPYLLAG